MEGAALVPKASLAGAQLPEVLGRLGHLLAVEADGDAPRVLAADGDVKENLGGDLATGGHGANAKAGPRDRHSRRPGAQGSGAGQGGAASGEVGGAGGLDGLARGGGGGRQAAQPHCGRGLRGNWGADRG